jgi:hypothetical protein
MNEKVIHLLAKDLIKFKTSTITKDGTIRYIFSAQGKEEYEVHIWDEKVKGTFTPIHRWNCTCQRGSIINPTYNTDCNHILACRILMAIPNIKELLNGKT